MRTSTDNSAISKNKILLHVLDIKKHDFKWRKSARVEISRSLPGKGSWHTACDPATPAYLASTRLPQRFSEDLSTFQKLCSNTAVASLEWNEDGYPRTECESVSGMI